MSQIEQIQQQLCQLPFEKQREVFDFVLFLQQQLTTTQQRFKRHSLRQHPAFGSWRERKIDALDYQRALRSDWDTRI